MMWKDSPRHSVLGYEKKINTQIICIVGHLNILKILNHISIFTYIPICT